MGVRAQALALTPATLTTSARRLGAGPAARPRSVGRVPMEAAVRSRRSGAAHGRKAADGPCQTARAATNWSPGIPAMSGA